MKNSYSFISYNCKVPLHETNGNISTNISYKYLYITYKTLGGLPPWRGRNADCEALGWRLVGNLREYKDETGRSMEDSVPGNESEQSSNTAGP